MDNNTQNNQPVESMPANAPASAKSPLPWIILAILVLVAAGGYWWWQMSAYNAQPQIVASPSPTPAFDEDTQGDINEIEAATSSDLDAEFQSIDQGINEL